MLVVVNADNFILLFIGWEGVSLCSYLLIGYYYGDEREYWIGGPSGEAPLHPPSYCSSRTFITVGSADSVMLVGILTLVVLTGSPYYEDLSIIKSLVSNGLPVWSVLTPLILLLTGPLAKSAQFPLHIWLPYAMAGPTPVSALLHSATMVKAGVYLIIRLLPELVGISEVVDNASIIFTVLAVAGVLSMVDGAVNAGRALELKKVLAYSTISQIGYMFLILGIAGLTETITNGIVASVYHMISHAVFKSALFLIAGILIHLSGTIYITEMRFPLKNRNNLILFLITLISCLNLLGIPPLIGFWSKEFIIEIIHFKELYIPLSIIIITTFLTAFYATRMITLIFLSHEKQHKLYDVYMMSKLLIYPIIPLIITMVYLGVIGYWFKHTLIDILTITEEEVEYISTNPLITWSTIPATVLGVVLALIRYELRVLHLVSPTNIANLISHTINYLIHSISRLGVSFVRRVTLLIYTVGGSIARGVEEVFNGLEHTLNTTVRYVGMVISRYLSILFKMINYADMDSFLTLYIITLAMILTYVLIMYNLHLLITG
jgi:NADH-quinone oxidoreductase subunit L